MYRDSFQHSTLESAKSLKAALREKPLMNKLMTIAVVFILVACASRTPRMTEIDHDRADCARMGGTLKIESKEVSCHLPNGEVLDWLDLMLE